MPRVMYAMLAGQNGLRMSRAAFALLIKFGDMLEDFVSLVDQVRFYNEHTQAQDLNALIKILKELPQFFPIRNKWEQASKMRKWINEKKGKLSVRYESEVKEEVLKQKREREAEAKVKAKEQDGEQIDSSSKPEAEVQAQGSTEKAKKQLTEEEETHVQDEAFNRLEKELEDIFGKIKYKSEFLMKL